MNKFLQPMTWYNIKPLVLNGIGKIIDAITKNCNCDEPKYKKIIKLLKNLCALINLSADFPKEPLSKEDEEIMLEVLEEVAEYTIKDKDQLEKIKSAIEFKKQYNDASYICRLFYYFN